MISSIINAMIYPAPRIAVTAPPPGFEEIFISYDNSHTICTWGTNSLSATINSPVVLLFHGNGENLETMKLSGTLQQFQSLNIAFLAVDYPGYGKSDGNASEHNLILSANSAFQWLRERHPENPLIICGWSLGAGVGIQVAANFRDDIAGLILLSPWSSLKDVASVHYPKWLVKKFLTEEYNSLRAAPHIHTPTLIFHGESDFIIPVIQGKRLAQAFPNPVNLITLPGIGHNDIFSHPVVWQEMRVFLDSMR